MSCGYTVPVTEALVAEETAALLRPLDSLRACLLSGSGVIDSPKVIHPLPCIPDDMMQSQLILRRKRVHRGGGFVAISHRVLAGEHSLEDIRHVSSVGKDLVPPREEHSIPPSARSKLPLCLGWETGVVSPPTEGGGVVPGGVDDWVVRPSGGEDVGVWPLRESPGRVWNGYPPLGVLDCLGEPLHVLLGNGIAEDKGPAVLLAVGEIAGVLDEESIVGIANLELVNEEGLHFRSPSVLAVDVHQRFSCAHVELHPRHKHHVLLNLAGVPVG